MKKFIFTFASVLILSFCIFAQSTTTQRLNSNPVQIGKILNGTSYTSAGAYTIGSVTNLNSFDTYRTYFEFDLSSIPTNATITNVYVTYNTIRSVSFSFNLTQLALGAISSSDWKANWQAIASATIIHTLNNTGSSFSSDNIKSFIQSSLSSRRIYIGAFSNGENSSESYNTLDVNLDVTYSTPPVAFNLTVRNDLQGMDGGNIGVGVYPAAASPFGSPHPTIVNENDQLNLAAYDNQSVSGYNWIFNNTEGPSNRSNWDSYANGLHNDWGGYQTFTSRKLTTNDRNSVISAMMKKLKTTTSGTLTEDENWFTNGIALSGDVIVPSGRTLKLWKDTDLKLNGYSIISTGGTITDEGAILTGACVKTSSNVIVGYYGRIQKACDAASSGQKIEIKPGAYNESPSLTGKSSVTISGYSATINGSINLVNNSYCNLYGVYLPTGQVYISGGIGIVVMDVRSDAGNRSLNIENTTNNAVYNLTAANGDMEDFGVNIYNSTGDICRSSRIENQMCGIFLYGGHYNVTEDYFCSNGYDVDAEGGGYAYLMNNTMSRINPASVYGTIYFDEPPTVACSSPSGLAKSNTASLSMNTQTEAKGTPTDDLNRIYSDLLHRTSQDTALNHKSLIEKYKAEYLSIAEKSKAELKKSTQDISRLKNYLSLTVNCLRFLGEEESLKTYLNELLGTSSFQSYSPYIKKYFIPGLIGRNDFNGALALCDEVLKNKDIDKDLTCEMLYEKGIINRFFLNNNAEAYKAFSSITAKYPDHPLGKMASGQISDMPGIKVENPEPKSLGSTSEGFTCSNYPNPFNPSTRFTFSIPGDGFTELKIYNSLGQEVKTLVSDYLAKGKYTFEWNAGSYSSGIYYYFLKSGNNVTTSKIILLK